MAAAIYYLVLPTAILVQAIHDPGLRTGQIPRFAFWLHRSLSQRIEQWARARVASGQAASVNTYDVSGTEWPIFSSVFYLWATDGLQAAWEKDPSLSSSMPSKYAHGAIEAVTALIADPKQAGWVKNYWGDDYLTHADLFYRMLLISGLTSDEKLLADRAHEQLLREQTNSLALELDQSAFGLLDDYPGQCYPVDVLPAIAAIRRADAVLGTDHRVFAARAVRGFQGTRLDAQTGLPAYVADSQTGAGEGSARGVGLSFMLTWAPQLWPETDQQWYDRYQRQFWQDGWLVAGFREFPKNYHGTGVWFDVDAGPVIGGYGTAASAFGIGAARANGHFEQAYPLSAEALVASWPLPDGTLLIPRLLSNLSAAPYVGESALLFTLTRQPVTADGQASSNLPFAVYLALAAYAASAVAAIGLGIQRLLSFEKSAPRRRVRISSLMFRAWLLLVLAGGIAFVASHGFAGALLLVAAELMTWKK